MIYTFDEQIKKYKEFSYDSYGLHPVYNNQDVYELLEELKKEYAPTVEMTMEGHDMLFKYLEYSTFAGFIQEVLVDYSTRERLYGDLSIEDLMQAWLHPETIKVVDE